MDRPYRYLLYRGAAVYCGRTRLYDEAEGYQPIMLVCGERYPIDVRCDTLSIIAHHTIVHIYWDGACSGERRTWIRYKRGRVYGDWRIPWPSRLGQACGPGGTHICAQGIALPLGA